MADGAPQDGPEWAMVFEPGSAVTEDVAATAFAQKFKGRLAYCHSRGKWLEYDGAIWRTHDTPRAFHYCRELARQLSMASNQQSTMQKTRFAAGVEKFAQADPVFARSAAHWDKDPMLLGTPDGTVDLTTGRLRPSAQVDAITKSVAVTPDEFEDCPTWSEFLEQATGGDEAMQRFLQQICGYALTGLVDEQALFFIYGPGGNGKGVFLNTIQAIMADYCVTATMETFEKQRGQAHTTDLAMMHGARIVTASETEEGAAWNEKRLKAVTGDDPITARFMRQDNFTFMPQFTLVIVGNHKPSLQTVDDAMKRRFNMIPFTIKPKKKDPKLRQKLKAEWPGILRWMINGCLDWQKNGLVRPQSVLDATAEYFEDQNTLAQWMDERCNVDHDNVHLKAPSSTLFASWQAYAIAASVKAGNAKSFKDTMTKAGFKFTKDRAGRWFHGIELRYDHGPDDSYEVR